MDINDSYYHNASNHFPTVTSHKWMNGLNKTLNESANLVKKAAPLVHCNFPCQCVESGMMDVFKATGINNYSAHLHFTIIIIPIKNC